MTVKVIELNDKAIRAGDESGILISSPGFALADGDTVLLGEEAERQARLKPTNSFNKFWHQLSLDPLSQHQKFRHFADIAHAHLLYLAEQAGIEDEVIFAVPGNFTRQQLAILLGLAQHSPLQPVGVVDSALAAGLAAGHAERTIYADIQLHQVVLTRLVRKSGRLQTDSVIQVPGVGSQNFMALMMQLATGLFIQQCRFNPQHNAESEQQLYNALPTWLAQDEKEGNLILELQSGTGSHFAKMPRESLLSSLNGHYRTIEEQIAHLAARHRVQLLLSADLAALPGLLDTLNHYPDLLVLEPEALTGSCLSYRELITGGEDGIHLVTALPTEEPAHTASGSAMTEPPTHALFNHRAFPVAGLEIRNRQQLNGHDAASAGLVLNIAGLPESLGHIRQREDGLYFSGGDQEFFINQQRCQGEQKLQLGDRIKFAGSNEVISLIRVADG